MTEVEKLIETVADAMCSIDNVPLFLADYSEVYDAMLAVQGYLYTLKTSKDTGL